jgi:hypothetical protein
MTTATNPASTRTLLQRATDKLYEIAGGSRDSGDVRAAKLTTAQRIAYFRSPEFRDWVASEKASNREVFWLKDVDKTQAAGDIFTFFFKWRADHGKFTEAQLKVIDSFLLSKRHPLVRPFLFLGSRTPHHVVGSWQQKEQGGDGISMLDFWAGAYWPSQIGLTEAEKLAQVREFAPYYAAKVYPGVAEENRLLEEIGVNVVIVSNGDQELARAVAPVLGINPLNVVGSHLIYGEDGHATGVNHTYEVFDDVWNRRPQPGKPLSFHYWMHMNRQRWGWKHLDEDKIVIAGRDGDSAPADGGMMIMLPIPASIGNFMIDTPGEPDRIEKFYRMAAKYGWSGGKFITLIQHPSQTGSVPD